MRRRLASVALLGSTLALGLSLVTTQPVAAAPATAAAPNITMQQCTDGGGVVEFQYLQGLLCRGGTYNLRWIVGPIQGG